VVVTYDPSTKLLLLGCSNGTMMAYDVKTLRYRWSVRGQTDIILDLVPITHKSLVAATSLDGTVALWDTDRQHATRRFKPPAPVDKLLPVSQLDLLVGKCCMNLVLGWDLALGEQCFLIDAHTAPITDIALLESAPPRLVTMDSSAIFKVWELALFGGGTVPCVMTYRADALAASPPRLCAITVAPRYRGKTDAWMAEQRKAGVGAEEADGGGGDGEALGPGVVGDIVVAAPRLHRVVSIPMDATEPPAAVLYNPVMAHFLSVTQRDVLLYDYDTGKVTSIFSTVATPGVELSAAVLDDRCRKLFVGRQDGSIVAVNLQNGAIMKSTVPDLPLQTVLAMVYDHRDRLLIAVGGKALAVFDDETQVRGSRPPTSPSPRHP